jgi:hypothetical protein
MKKLAERKRRQALNKSNNTNFEPYKSNLTHKKGTASVLISSEV